MQRTIAPSPSGDGLARAAAVPGDAPGHVARLGELGSFGSIRRPSGGAERASATSCS